MVQMLNAQAVVQALYVAAELGIADLLAEGAKTSDQLASATGAHGPSLYRLLRTLAGEDVFREVEDGRFALTPLGETLRSDTPDSVRDRALYLAAPEFWTVWGEFRHSVMTGETALEYRYGVPAFKFLAQHPEIARPFNGWMTKSSEQDNAAVVAGYNFSSLHTLVDVGGGQGATLAAILRAYPALKGTLFDLPPVVETAAAPKAPDIRERCKTVGGDMLQSVPAGADGYLIKMVLMDEPDGGAVKILKNCADAMVPEGRVLVVEMLLAPSAHPSLINGMDLLMLILTGGRVRREVEFAALFAAAGLRLVRVVETSSTTFPMFILEGVRT